LYIQQQSSDGCVSFVNQAPVAMSAPSRIRTVIVADWDNDGYEEIFWNNIPGENRLFRKLPTDSDWTQVDIGDALEADGYGTGAAVADFDEDGQLELLVSHGESSSQPMSYFRPLSGSSNHWIRIFPKTSQGAPSRGALVVLHAGGRNQTRVIDSGSGYLCQMEPVAHFGLGSLTAIVSVTVTWPDGAQLEVVNLDVDRLHSVLKPAQATVVPAHILTLEGNCLKRIGVSTSVNILPSGPEAATTGIPSGSPRPMNFLGQSSQTLVGFFIIAFYMYTGF